DAEKCARYRITNQAGGMCGRCMKTCPWNLQGLFAEAPFRWLAMNAPGTAKALAGLDDRLGRGAINPVKAWWWDIELDKPGKRYVAAAQTNRRGLSPDLDLKYEDQTLAVYPADVMPLPFPITQPLNREEGIARYRALLTPEEYRNRLAKGQTEGLVPGTRPPGEPPVFPMVIARREDLSDDTVRFELTRADGQPLPPFDAGAHVSLMIAPEYQRDYSLAGDPADAAKYVLGIQRESAGRGGSLLIHRVFRPGRRVFVTPPSNLFPLDEGAPFSLLLGGGIGITPMLTMAHRLHALGRDFRLHYLARGTAPFGAEIAAAPWADRAQTHLKTTGPRVDMRTLIPPYTPGAKLYTCGGAGFMDGVFDTARAQGWPEDALAREYFAVPEAPDWVNHPFTLRLTQSGRDIPVAADQSATEALAAHGIAVPTKCSDGICGVCAVTHHAPEGIEHRDYVLSARERESRVILCCSRAREDGGLLPVDL
ncbi:MAG: 2Fe-2S iron-sulfur cluster binding domain-containing protein, partial [Rhodobacteraceae bacterium]|nr:2Fe-2S iron-sulfur cluster binding domain-containing protein [Paracoccaceae bacterium]